jgi:hypothetical protein
MDNTRKIMNPPKIFKAHPPKFWVKKLKFTGFLKTPEKARVLNRITNRITYILKNKLRNIITIRKISLDILSIVQTISKRVNQGSYFNSTSESKFSLSAEINKEKFLFNHVSQLKC